MAKKKETQDASTMTDERSHEIEHPETKEAGHHPMTRQEAGRLGAQVRWGKGLGTQTRARGKHQEQRHPMTRQEAGRLGAQVRWGKGTERPAEHHRMTRQEAGRLGAEARWGRAKRTRPSRYEKERREFHSMSRQKAGKYRTEARWHPPYRDEEWDVRSRFSNRWNEERDFDFNPHQRESSRRPFYQDEGEYRPSNREWKEREDRRREEEWRTRKR